MKTLILAVAISLAAVSNSWALEAEQPPKTKKVCKDTKDRNGKKQTVCKTIKVHKKFEGTKVPAKK